MIELKEQVLENENSPPPMIQVSQKLFYLRGMH